MTTMHHVEVAIDPDTGEWLEGTCCYLGTVDAAQHRGRVDTDLAQYSEVDPEAAPAAVAAIEAAGQEVGRENIALTCIFA